MKNTTAANDGQEVPLVRAAFAEPFRVIMQKQGIDADAWFRKVQLPAVELTDPASLLPLKPFFHLVNQVAISENIPDFGMQVAQVKPWIEIETMKPHLENQPDLRSLLTRFCQLAAGQSSIVSFALSFDSDTCRFEYVNQPLTKTDIQMELYRVTGMIGLIQAFMGQDWRPQKVELLMAENRVARSNAILQGCDLDFASQVTAIHFPETILDTRRDIAKLAPPRIRNADEWKSLADKTGVIAALEKILDNYIVEPELSIKLVAGIVSVSPRNLQRLIKAHGKSYRQLLNAARKRYALNQLQANRQGIGEISRQLGYSDTSHFTRAFKKWTGLSPSQYRMQAN